MGPTPRTKPLTKREVETLLGSCEGAASSALEEITVVREALAVALGRLLAQQLDGPGATWADLVVAAADTGGWTAERRALVAAAGDPASQRDQEAVLDALWDLVQELNERRVL